MTLDQQIDYLVGQLSTPLTASERASGWTEATKIKWLRLFEDLKLRLDRGERISHTLFARAMDFDGITSGELLDRAARVGLELRQCS